jgi:predicted phosphohydrolase
MKIRYFSDLHLEFIKPNNIQNFLSNIPPGPEEICICAGDIGNPIDLNGHYDIFINFISKNFKKIFVIPGNHEYYQKSKTIPEINTFLIKYFEKFDNISFLHNSCEYYEDFCFIGTTLWSKVTNPMYEINDIYQIPAFDTFQYNKLNIKSVEFLEDALEKNENCIVITHHLPSSSLIDDKYKTARLRPYHQWFYCDLDAFIEANNDKIKCWVYGHTHTAAINKIHNVPFFCNPIGYPGENYESDFDKIFEI